MSSTPPGNPAVLITGEMTREQRRTAVRLLASGVRTVEMPVSPQIQHGEVVHSDDVRPARGTVVFTARAGQVRARRTAEETSGYMNGPGMRRFETSFTGEIDPESGVVWGTVASELKKWNRFVVPLAIFLALLGGGFFAVGVGHWWTMAIFAPVIFGLAMSVQYVSNRREARIMVSDLSRMAALAMGQQPGHRASR